MHDGEDTGAPVIVFLHGAIIGKHSPNQTLACSQRRGTEWRDQRVQFARIEHALEVFVFGNDRYLEIGRERDVGAIGVTSALEPAGMPSHIARSDAVIVLQDSADP